MKLNCQTTLENKSIKYWNRKRAESRMKGVRQEHDCIYQYLSRLSFFNLSIYLLSTYNFIYLSSYLFIYLSSFNIWFYLSILYLSTQSSSIHFLFSCQSIYRIYLSTYRTTSLYLFIYLSNLSIYPFVFIYLSIYSSVCVSVSLYVPNRIWHV